MPRNNCTDKKSLLTSSLWRVVSPGPSDEVAVKREELKSPQHHQGGGGQHHQGGGQHHQGGGAGTSDRGKMRVETRTDAQQALLGKFLSSVWVFEAWLPSFSPLFDTDLTCLACQVLVLCPFVWLCTCPHLSFVQLPHIENPTLHFRRNKQNNPHITPVQRFRT